MELDQAIARVAISKAIASKELDEASSSLPPGTKATIDVRVHVKGTLAKGVDFTVAPTTNVLTKATLAMLLSELGISRERVQTTLAKVLKRAVSAGRLVADELVAQDDELLLTIHDVEKDVLAKLPRAPRRGAVRVQALTKITSCKVEVA